MLAAPPLEEGEFIFIAIIVAICVGVLRDD